MTTATAAINRPDAPARPSHHAENQRTGPREGRGANKLKKSQKFQIDNDYGKRGRLGWWEKKIYQKEESAGSVSVLSISISMSTVDRGHLDYGKGLERETDARRSGVK